MPMRTPPGRSAADPFADLRRLQEEMRGWPRRQGWGWGPPRVAATSEYPPMNVWIGEHDTMVVVEVPGVRIDDLDVSIHDSTITVKGLRDQDPETREASAHRRERSLGSFARTIQVPFEIDRDRVQAECRNGILKIFLPRPETERPRRIKISGG